MRVHLIYLDTSSIYPPHYSCGLGSVAAVLRNAGHELTFSYIRNDEEAEVSLSLIEERRPQIVAFSSMSSMYPRVMQLAPLVKQVDNGIFTVCGGIHPTLEPGCLEETDGLDAICRGEGEDAFLDLLEAMESGREYLHIQNFNFRTDNGIVENPLRPLLENLDTLPFPDRELFGYEAIIDPRNSVYRCGIPNKRTGEFLFTRGCPFDCSFCSNRALRELYHGKYVRFRSVEKSIEELRTVIDRYRLEVILLHDDIITLKKDWFYDFFTHYVDSIRLPFVCNSRVGTCDEDMMRLLKEAGCHLLVFGVESGNDHIRNTVLKKRTSRAQILETFALAHKHGIRTYSQNMVGIPGETPRHFMDTINLNADLEPNTPGIGIFHPYPGTELGEMCREKGLIFRNELSAAERTETVLRLPGFRPEHIRYYNENFPDLVKRKARGNTKGLFCQETLLPPYPIFGGLIRYLENKRDAESASFLDRIKKVVRLVVGEELYSKMARVYRGILDQR